MYINRSITGQLLSLSQQYAALTILGPRQAGKTELVKKIFPNHTYINLENPEMRSLAASDSNAFFKEFPVNLILDEIQRVPSIL